MVDVTNQPGLGEIADAVTGLLKEALQEVAKGP